MTVDAGEVEVAHAAIKETIKGITVWGYKIADYVTEEQVRQVATAVVEATTAYREEPAAEG